MEMPGYKKKQVAEEQAKKAIERATKQKAETERLEKIRAAAQKLENDKKSAIESALKKQGAYSNTRKIAGFTLGGAIGATKGAVAPLGVSVLAQATLLLLGSAVWTLGLFLSEDMSNVYPHLDFSEEKNWVDQSYGDAMKDLWFMNKLATLPKERMVQIIALFATVGLIYSIVRLNKEVKKDKNFTIDQLYLHSETLKQYGLSSKDIEECYKRCGDLIISKMSEMDRGYVENLLVGGLNNANYETVVAIVEGHLKAHPDDYQQIIQIIDEATMPPELVKKYGKGKTISFGAAQVMSDMSKDR